MYLLYLDESGQHGGDHFVLAGVCLHEDQIFWVTDALNQIQREYFPGLPNQLFFHASAIRGGNEAPWPQLTNMQRREVLDRVYQIIARIRGVLFGIVIDRRWLPPSETAYEFAFENIAKRFDRFLNRVHRETNEHAHGLIVIAESSYHERVETLALRILNEGSRWGQLYNVIEVPLFTPAKNSRMLQVADFCANAIGGRYEGGYSRQFDLIAERFDSDGIVIHGLSHYSIDFRRCLCPACLTRRTAGRSFDSEWDDFGGASI